MAIHLSSRWLRLARLYTAFLRRKVDKRLVSPSSFFIQHRFAPHETHWIAASLRASQ
jgi:hypothetical protein